MNAIEHPGEPLERTGSHELADGTHVTSYRGTRTGKRYESHERPGQPVRWFSLDD